MLSAFFLSPVGNPGLALQWFWNILGGVGQCASLVPQSSWGVSDPAEGQQPTLPLQGLPPRQQGFLSLGPGTRLAYPEPPVLNVRATESPEGAALRATWGPTTAPPGWSPASRELTTELQLLLSIWTWWTELEDFHVCVDVSGLGPAAGAEDPSMTSGKEAPAALSGRPHQNSRPGVVLAHGLAGCQHPKCSETKPLFPPAEQLRPAGGRCSPGARRTPASRLSAFVQAASEMTTLK